jgi:hypothetical protein
MRYLVDVVILAVSAALAYYVNGYLSAAIMVAGVASGLVCTHVQRYRRLARIAEAESAAAIAGRIR